MAAAGAEPPGVTAQSPRESCRACQALSCGALMSLPPGGLAEGACRVSTAPSGPPPPADRRPGPQGPEKALTAGQPRPRPPRASRPSGGTAPLSSADPGERVDMRTPRGVCPRDTHRPRPRCSGCGKGPATRGGHVLLRTRSWSSWPPAPPSRCSRDRCGGCGLSPGAHAAWCDGHAPQSRSSGHARCFPASCKAEGGPPVRRPRPRVPAQPRRQRPRPGSSTRVSSFLGVSEGRCQGRVQSKRQTVPRVSHPGEQGAGLLRAELRRGRRSTQETARVSVRPGPVEVTLLTLVTPGRLPCCGRLTLWPSLHWHRSNCFSRGNCLKERGTLRGLS